MKYLTNDRNALRLASPITASNVVASSALYRTALLREGGGLVRLTGGYTGQADATFEVEVLNTTIVGTPRVSAPTFAGVGNGVMSAISAPGGMAAQEWSVTLVDLGTDTRKAYVPFQGVTLQARTAGTPGNLITITVNESGIAAAATSYSLLESLQAGSNEYTGAQWNFGAAVLNPDGTVPATAPRLRFGSDPQVYRAYKFYRDGQYVHGFSPAPVRDVEAGAPVYTITGSRTVVVTDGTTTNTYTTITTLFSLLSAINGDAAALLEVVEPVTNDLSPGGMGTQDLSVQTRSFVASINRDGTQYVQEADIGLGIGASSPTEVLTIRCSDAGIAGAERWAVAGTISGTRLEAVTAVAYTDGGFTFTIPARLPPGESPVGDNFAVFKIGTRPAGETVPSMCYENLVAGAEAQAKVYRFVWTRRPGAACDCDTAGIVGGPNDDYLGVDPPGGATVATIPAALQTRAEDLYAWRATFIEGNTSVAAPDALPTYTAWAATTAYTLGAFRRPTAANGRYYQVTVAGTSAGSEPTWPTILGTSVVDGTVTWTDAGLISDIATSHDVLVADWTDLTNRGSVFERVSAVLKVDRADIDAANKATSIFYATLRQLFDQYDPSAIPSAATTEWDAAFADLQTDFTALADNIGADFARRYAALLTGSPAVAAEIGTLHVANATRALAATLDAYLDRYRARMDKVLTLGSIEPDFDGAAHTGNGVWQDRGSDYWFASQDGLLPLFPGYYYHSARMGENATGDPVPVSTREFGIGVEIGCPELLTEGDAIEITLEPVANLRQTYQVGDTIEATIINGAPAQLGGGQTGDDTLTFSVVGSVDGALADYGVLKSAPSAYLDSGLGFLINPGGVPFALGDRFRFQVEGGQFRWRKNGGSWSAATQIAATVALSDGVSAAFDPGSAPSFLPADAYTFRAEALYGIAQGIVPTDARVAWTGSTVIDFTPTAALRSLRELVIFSHALPDTAAIRLQGSNDSFATTPYDQPVPWAESTIQHVLPAAILYARYRITIDTSGSAQWIWAGEGLQVTLPTGKREFGRLTKRYRLPGIARSAGQGVSVEHTALAQAAVDALIESLGHATLVDESRLGILPNDSEPSAAVVAIDADTLEVRDELDYQPRDTARRLLAVTLDLVPTP